MKRILQVGIMIGAMMASNGFAALYSVNRTFTDGTTSASLAGAVEIPIGNYVLTEGDPSPFTAVNLTLTINGTTSYAVNNVLTDLIRGTAEFHVSATPSVLRFATANADGANPADLVFSDNTDPEVNNRYVIGANGNPGFEVAYTDAGAALVGVTFPTVFGRVVCCPKSQGYWKQVTPDACEKAMLSAPSKGNAAVVLSKQMIAADHNIYELGCIPVDPVGFSAVLDAWNDAWEIGYATFPEAETWCDVLASAPVPTKTETGQLMVANAAVLELFNSGFYNDCDGDGFSPSMGDCNDSDGCVNPVAPEICGNGIDDNCNGLIDEDCL